MLTRQVIVNSIRHLWPRKQIVRSCLVPAHIDEPELVVDHWVHHFKGDVSAAESFINHVHLPDLIIGLDDAASTTIDELRTIAETYVALLHSEIKRVAPGQPYEVSVTGDFDIIPQVDFPDGRSVLLPEVMNVEITCWLKR